MTDAAQAFSVDAGPVVLDESGVPLLDRELSVLAFNERVLHQARRVDVPLLERLRYITIVSSNMDEFFEVRFADFLEAARTGQLGASQRDLQTVAAEAHRIIDDQYAVFNDELTPLLQREDRADLGLHFKLAPDNQFHQLSLAGGWNFSSSTRARETSKRARPSRKAAPLRQSGRVRWAMQVDRSGARRVGSVQQRWLASQSSRTSASQ